KPPSASRAGPRPTRSGGGASTQGAAARLLRPARAPGRPPGAPPAPQPGRPPGRPPARPPGGPPRPPPAPAPGRAPGPPAGEGPDGLGHRLARSLGHLAYARRFLVEAVGHYQAAAARAPDPGQAAADLRSAADVALATGRGDTAFRLLLEAADRASAAGDDGTRAAALAYAVAVARRLAASFCH